MSIYDEFELEMTRRRRRNSVLGGISSVLAWFFTMAFVVAGILGLTWVLNSPPCHARGAMMGLPAEYGFFTGCMVQVDRRWIPIESYRVVGSVE